MSMNDDYEDVRAEVLLNLEKLICPEETKMGYRGEINEIVILLVRDKTLRQALKKIEEVSRENRFELMEIAEKRKAKLLALIESNSPSTKMLVEDHRREAELKVSLTILDDASSLVEKEIKEVGKKLLDIRKTCSWLRGEVARQEPYIAAGRLENNPNFERIF